MPGQSLIVILVVFGAMVGWLEGTILGGGGGLVRNAITGVVGAFVGYYLLRYAGVQIKAPVILALASAGIGVLVISIVLRMVGR